MQLQLMFAMLSNVVLKYLLQSDSINNETVKM